MFPATNGYPQSAFPTSYYNNNSQRSSGPPPAKRSRGNPIITRYPPLPGYRGPPQHQSQPQNSAWHNSAPSHQPGYPPYSQTYPQSATPYGGYPPQYPGQNASAPLIPQGWPTPQPYYQPPINTPLSAPVFPTWQQSQPPANTRRHNSAPFPTSRHSSWQGPLLDGNGDPFDTPTETHEEDPNNLESEYDGECYFARHPEEINPDLSLGLIEWKAAIPTQRALPGTFAEAELEKIAPRKFEPSGDGCVSEYFTWDKREESLLSVRQLDRWEEVKADLIYVEFPAVCREFITLRNLLAHFRCRIDQAWIEAGSALNMDDSRAGTPIGDGLEEKRMNGIKSGRDRTQEEILAALGVTGSPKLPDHFEKSSVRKRGHSEVDW